MIKKWNRQKSDILNNYRIFNIRKDTSISPVTGKEHEFYVIESADWVNVVAITQDEEIVLIKQYRHGIMDITLEIPGGMVDKGESPIQSARRELLEETGYTSENWVEIGVVNPNPAILNNKCYSYLALNSIKSGNQKLEGTEDIQVITVPVSNTNLLVSSGEITHSLVICALHYYEKHKSTL